MRVLSVNAGLPREVTWRGKPVTTGIYKEPADGRVPVRRLNLDGDRQADLRVHGGPDKAVYAYPSEFYELWSRERPELDLGPGAFGENLTTSGIAIAEARIGERWRVGSALLEVSEPRQPCSTLGAKMGDQRFVRRFAKALRLGTYMRIIEPGVVAAGDAIDVVDRPDHEVTVGLLGRVLFEDSSLGPQVLAAGALTDAWRAHGERLAAKQRQ